MKELIQMFVEDYLKEAFTCKQWLVAAAACVTLFGIMVLAGAIEPS